MKTLKVSSASAAFLLCLALSAIPTAVYGAEMQRSLDWLLGQQHENGSWYGRDPSLATRDSSEVLATLADIVGTGSAPYVRGARFMRGVKAHDTDTLARKLVVGHSIGAVNPEEEAQLSSVRTATGGYAVAKGWRSAETHDILLGLRYLAAIGSPLAEATAKQLAAVQNNDGSFGPASHLNPP